MTGRSNAWQPDGNGYWFDQNADYPNGIYTDGKGMYALPGGQFQPGLPQPAQPWMNFQPWATPQYLPRDQRLAAGPNGSVINMIPAEGALDRRGRYLPPPAPVYSNAWVPDPSGKLYIDYDYGIYYDPSTGMYAAPGGQWQSTPPITQPQQQPQQPQMPYGGYGQPYPQQPYGQMPQNGQGSYVPAPGGVSYVGAPPPAGGSSAGGTVLRWGPMQNTTVFGSTINRPQQNGGGYYPAPARR